MTRSFEDRPAVRERVPLLLGIMGPSGSGKTMSALRLASGIQRVVGGEVFALDTEARRMLAYSELFKFRHVDFKPPYSSADYLAAIRHCHSRGAKTIIVDSATHEWEGSGGVLEAQAAEVERMSGGDYQKAERVKMAAWIKPKAEHRKFISGFLEMDCNFIFLFRAREKIKPERGGKPVELGFQPIAPDDIVFEMTLNCLLLPGAEGIPTWHPEFQGEKAMVKLPLMFREIFSKNPPPQLTEDIGEQLARWAAGGAPAAKPTAKPESRAAVVDLLELYEVCTTPGEYDALEAKRKELWPSAGKGEKERLKAAQEATHERLSKEVPA